MSFAPDPSSPHAEVLLTLSEQNWAQWQHHPISRAFLAFQDDQIEAWRDLCAELVEGGAFRLGDPHEDRNPDVVRGKLLALKQLRRISLAEIQSFYGKEPPADTEQADT